MRFDKLEFPDETPKPRDPGVDPAAKDEQHWLKQADLHRRNGNYENALRFYSRALEIEKSLVVAWVGQVQMLVHLGEFPQAELWSRKALELFPNQCDLSSGRAQSLCRMGDTQKATRCQRRGHATARRFRLLLDGARRIDGGRASGKRPLLLRPGANRQPRLAGAPGGGLNLFVLSLSEQGIAAAQLAVESASQAYYVWLVLGRCQQELGFTTSARNSYDRCLELCPRHQEASQRLAELGQESWTTTIRRWLRPRDSRR